MNSINRSLSRFWSIRFFRQANLFWKREEIDQHEARELVSLFRLLKRDPINVMQGIVSDKSQAVGPFLNGWGNQVPFSETFNSVPEGFINEVWCNQFCSNFKCSTIHGCRRLSISTKNIFLGLNKCFRNIFRAMIWSAGGFRCWINPTYFNFINLSQIAMETGRFIATINFNIRRYWFIAVVATKHCVPSISVRALRLSNKCQTGVFNAAMWAI